MIKQIDKIEQAYQRFGVDSFTFNVASNDLRIQIRKYLDEKDIKNDVHNTIQKEVKSNGRY